MIGAGCSANIAVAWLPLSPVTSTRMFAPRPLTRLPSSYSSYVGGGSPPSFCAKKISNQTRKKLPRKNEQLAAANLEMPFEEDVAGPSDVGPEIVRVEIPLQRKALHNELGTVMHPKSVLAKGPHVIWGGQRDSHSHGAYGCCPGALLEPHTGDIRQLQSSPVIRREIQRAEAGGWRAGGGGDPIFDET